MSELDDYKRAMRPDQPEPMCVRLCATVARLREELAEATTLIGVLNKGRVGREYTVGPEGPTC